MNTYAFIDSQNLNLAILEQGWKLDFRKFRIYLKERFGVEKAYLFLGYIRENKRLYTFLKESGYILVFKPTLKYGNGVVKGNCDAELVLHCMIEKDNFDKAIIVAGDGDYYCLIEYLENQNKLLSVGIPNSRCYSALLRRFSKYFFYVDKLKGKMEFKKREV